MALVNFGPRSFVAMALCSASALGATPLTCFNDDDPQGRIGIWTYEGPAGRTGKVTAPVLALGYVPGQNEYRVADLWYCFYTPRPKVRGIINCRSGSLRVSRSGLPGLLSIEYEFILSNGEIKTATYDAGHCGQSVP